ncbi:FAD:protein FMN transferase [Immundisolibacter sp.]|uniref:FAD:protein FMN transferase n=1 Tax=Immundisolibacter sp. TaxID=1934948 RepID=UPI003567BC8B
MNAPLGLAADSTGVVRRAQPWLGTLVGVEAAGLPRVALEHAVARALRAVARVHALMSFHDPDSELSRLNRQAATTPTTVSGHLWQVLRATGRVSALTDGRFDVTVAPTLVHWGYLPKRGTVERGGRWYDVHLGERRTVHFRKPLLIDLGGIAKGYAVDLAIATLRRAGVPQACVNAGGDLRFYGPTARQIAIRDPGDPGRLHLLPPRLAGAVASSCVLDTRRRRGRGWCSPLVDPLSGRALGSGDSVTVLADRCLYADALTKPAALDPSTARTALHRLRAQALHLPAA